MNKEEKKRIDPEYKKILIKGVIRLFIFLILLFLIAGRITYWQGWVFSGTLIIQFIVAYPLFSDRMDLIKERLKPGPGTKWWDKIFLTFLVIFGLAIFIISLLDSGRFRWTTYFPGIVYLVGYLLYLVSIVIGYWAMRVNRFFSSVVRIQKDRNQIVIQSGPYQFVRHPGYAGGILASLSIPLMLGSIAGLMPVVFIIIILILRTYLEDITLQMELDGYVEYTKKVKYKLIPGIW
jgi:protein-S-isoprenylcysteine O-methyltransferase Ste14